MFLKAPARVHARGGRLVAGDGARPQRRSRTESPVRVRSPVIMRASLMPLFFFGRRWAAQTDPDPRQRPAGTSGPGSPFLAETTASTAGNCVTCLPAHAFLTDA